MSEPTKAPFGAEFLPRVLSGLVLAPVAVGVTWLGGPLFTAACVVIALILFWEWNGLTREKGADILFLAGAATILGVGVALALGAKVVAFGLLVGSFLALVTTANAPSHVAWFTRGLVYALMLLVPTVLLRESATLGFAAIFFLFAVVWSTDVLAFFAGRLIGGPKLMPAVSPKKTWSGSLGGLVGGVLGGILTWWLFGLPALPAVVVLALVLSAVSQMGDLFESWVKRRFDKKDSGQLIPGHGGLMDRLDSFVFAGALALAIGLARGGLGDVGGGLLRWG